ncbi:MAG: carbohydrate binding domain-containing protein [Clostridia bacterium]|nr:carbohydrate binding domain-containing protein [Clostridia bacterium]
MQTNLRKVLAILSVMAMLCTLLPLSALVSAADVEMLTNGNFETGNANGWTLDSGSSVSSSDKHGGSYAIKTTNTATKYQSMFYQLFEVMPNTDYTLTYWYKYDGTGSAPAIYVFIKDAGRDVTLNDSTSRRDGLTSGSWVKDTFTFNTGDYEQVTINFANRVAGLGGTFYFDDISVMGPEIVTPEEPENPVPEVADNLIANGNFETGHSDGWEKHQSTAFTAEAAYTGYYGAKLVGNGGWGGMLNQSVAVEAGQTYKVSMWVKTVSNGVNIQIKDGGENGAKLGSDWFTATEWTYKNWTVSPTTNALFLNFCGGGNGVAETVYVDDVVVVKAPLIENGDFETGDKTGWSCNSGTSTIVTDAHGGNYALQLSNPDKWGEAAVRTIGVKPNTQYEVSWWSKRVSGTGAFNLIVCQAVSPWANFERLSGENWMNKSADNGWVKNTCVYNTGNNTQMLLKFTSEAANAGTIIIDDVTVEELKEPSFDGYIYNGDFETGKSSGWNLMQQSEITKGASCNGQYGLHLQGNGGWGTMAEQIITTVPGQNYTIFAYVKTNAAGTNVQIKDKDTDAKLASTWYNKTDWRLVQLNFIATGTSTRVVFSGGGTSVAENVYVDDIFMVLTKAMSTDGYIFNGDFESGSLIGWTTHQQSVLSNKAAYEGTAGIIMKGTGWGGTANQTFPVDMGNTYKLSFWYKPISNGINVQVLDEADSSKITSQYISTSDGSDWMLFEKTFNVGYTTKVTLNFCGSGSSSADEMYIDNIAIVNIDGEENVRNTLTQNGGSSVRDVADDIRGLAFRFHLNASGVQIVEGNKFVANSGKLDLYKNRKVEGTLVRAGAVVTRKAEIGKSFTDFTLDSLDDGTYVIDIPAVYLMEKTADSISYVVRVVDIPDNHTATELYARPYYVYNVGGEEVTVYGTMVHGNYDVVAGEHKSIKVLAIGDDSSVDAMENHLGDILESADYDRVVLGNLYNDGALHYAADYTYAQYQYGQWTTESGVSAADVLAEDWDYVVIQSAEDEDTANLQTFIGAVDAATEAPLYWNMPWAIENEYEDIVADAQQINNVTLIPTGTALENILGTGLDESLFVANGSLNDGCGDYIAALTWFAVLTGDTLDQVDYYPVAVYSYAYDVARSVAHAMYAPYAVSDLSEVILLAGSDFQPHGGNVEAGRETVRNILGALADAGYGLFDGFMSGGDYSAGTTEPETSAGLAGLDAEISKVVYNNKFYSQGNHDPKTTVGMTPHGANDPLGAPYGLFLINEDNYTDLGEGGESVAKELDAYFEAKLNRNWGNKPIFVLCHVPLNFSMRTVSGKNARTAMPIVESLNKAGAQGLNIIFLFGHNHSSGYDNYIGGGSVYLKKGDTMLVPHYDNYLVADEVTLNFTYMTAGYIGYYGTTVNGADGALTMTVFRIQKDGSVIVGRYDQNGIHNLKSAGAKNTDKGDTMEPDPTVYESYRVVTSDDDQPYVAQ